MPTPRSATCDSQPAELLKLRARLLGNRAYGTHCNAGNGRLAVLENGINVGCNLFVVPQCTNRRTLYPPPIRVSTRRRALPNCAPKPEQKAELAAILAANPKMRRTELWRTVRVRFGADYMMSGLNRLVREDLGFTFAGR